jgi:hypothetical protein
VIENRSKVLTGWRQKGTRGGSSAASTDDGHYTGNIEAQHQRHSLRKPLPTFDASQINADQRKDKWFNRLNCDACFQKLTLDLR